MNNNNKTSAKGHKPAKDRLQSKTTKGANPDETSTTQPPCLLENQWWKHHRLKHGPVMATTISLLP
jgi:hypothetical protein